MNAELDVQPTLRLHPWSWLFAALSFLRQMIIPIVAVLVFGARNDGALWGLLLLAPILAVALWQQWVFRYGFGARGLVIHEGLVFRTIRHVDYHRIENIDTQRNLLHRLFGVAQLRIETSTGGRPEAVFRVLGLGAVDALRQRVFAESQRPEVSVDADVAVEAVGSGTSVIRLPTAELVRYGLIDNRGLIVVAALFGMLQQAGLFRMLQERIQQWLRELAVDALAALDPVAQGLLIVLTLLVLLAAVRGLSVLFAILSFHGFTLTAANGDLRVRYGLVTRVARTLRIARIQAVHQTESLLHRWFGRVSLRVDLAGGLDRSDGDTVTERTNWLAPVCTPADARQLMRQALPDIDFDVIPEWLGLAPGAGRRLFKRSATLWTVALLLPATWIAGAWGLALPLIVVPWAGVHAILYVRHTRWALTGDAVMFREGWLNRRLIIAPRSRVQSTVWLQSPFDRRYRMATAAVDTAGVRRGQYIRIRYLPEDVASELTGALYRSPQRPIGARAPVTEGRFDRAIVT
jgi:putative membrane protein